MDHDQIELTPANRAFLNQHMARAASPQVLHDLNRSLGGRSDATARQDALRAMIATATKGGSGGLSKAGAFGELRMSDLLPAVPANAQRAFSQRDLSRPSGESTYSASIVAESLVARAGAKVIFMPPPAPVGREGAFYTRPGRYLTITPAQFQPVADGADATPGPLPFLSADFSSEYGEATAAYRFEITRGDQRNMTPDELQFIIAQSVVRGLARLADRTLLQALVATTPGAWSLAAAAAHGLNFHELAAIAGSSATGAAVGADGVLRAGGLPAELTDAINGTIAGAFNRAAVVTEDEYRVLIERRDLQANLKVTVFASMTAAISDPDAFFLVAV